MTTISPTGTTSVNDKLIGYIRTYVPYGIGAVLTWLLTHIGLDLRGPVQVALVAFSVAVVTNVYYLGVRLFEEHWPSYGVLLGFPQKPQYTAVDNLWASLVRTVIPTLVGAVVVSVLSIWIHVSATTQSWLITTATAVVTSLYYTVAREVTDKWPAAKVLLGTSIPATYTAASDGTVTATTVTATPSAPVTAPVTPDAPVTTPAPVQAATVDPVPATTATEASSTVPVASAGPVAADSTPTDDAATTPADPETAADPIVTDSDLSPAANPTVDPETPEQATGTATLDPSDPAASGS